MTKEEFKTRWDSNDEGGGITFDDIAECAVKWGLYSKPKIHPMNEVSKAVLEKAGVSDDLSSNDTEQVG